ncbi:Flp pilus assembly protein CpaB [Pseudarthrobacter sp. efr-133-R2A-89]|uniref:Flp pilus assembly protein CpaB n=1 Tax=Pseudarthrobacter sp. efr-133-R2A-89 TaxID=3040302 RepID=UPI002552B6B5|nr:Flp pilus assembly protein CpaB [Pseudarthrobacter sp. efr-133-R2A-89]
MKSRMLAGVSAVVLAIIGAVLIVTYAQGADARAMKDMDPTGVLVVTKAVPAGSSFDIVQASVAVQQVPATAVSKTALKNLDDSAGKVAAVDLVPGEQLLAERLVDPQDAKSSGSVKVPAGMQEVTFELEAKRVVGGRIEAGDHIGIGFSFSAGADKTKPGEATTQLTLRKILVTAVQRAPQPSAKPTDGSNPQDTTLPQGSFMVTVAVSDIDATKIIYSSNNGDLWLTKEPLDAQDNGGFIARKDTVYK